jgi:hypothetical protein
LVHFPLDQTEPPQRIRLADRQVGQDRGHPVGDRARFVRAADRYRDQAAHHHPVGQLTTFAQQVAEATGDRGEHDVVDSHAVGRADLLQLG